MRHRIPARSDYRLDLSRPRQPHLVPVTSILVLLLAAPTACPVVGRGLTFRRMLSVTVKDPDHGGALAGVEVARRIGNGPSQRFGPSDWTGVVKIKLRARRFEPITLTIDHAGYVPMKATWPGIDRLPARLVLKLARATTIGGVIRDEGGTPIPGATIKLTALGPSQYESFDLKSYPVRSDVEGRWCLDKAPRELLSVFVSISHPDFAAEGLFTYRDVSTREKLRELGLVTVLKKGVSIPGLVLDGKGRPIQGASVGLWGLDPEFYEIAKTGEAGRFQTEPVASGTSADVVVAAPGYAPDFKKTEAQPGMEAVRFRLGPAHTIRGRVVDENNRPVAGASINVERWRGGYVSVHWEALTDAAGRFVWKDAPADPVCFFVHKRGYAPLYDVEISPSPREHTLTLEANLRIRGRAVDADTGRPILEFSVMQRHTGDNGQTSAWYQRGREYFALGRYETTVHRGWSQFALRFEADGYKPAISEVLTNAGPEQVLDVKLEHGWGTRGKAYLPEGGPASDALVAAFDGQVTVRTHNGKLQYAAEAFKVCRTGEQGEFTLPPEPEPFKVVLLHDQGFAEVEGRRFDTSESVWLSKWGHLEGTVRIGSNRAPGEKVKLWYSPAEKEDPGVDWDYETTTDDDGRFRFDRVKPGRVSIGRMTEEAKGSELYAICVVASVEPGETTRVDLGGTGRPVVGRLRSSGAPDEEETDWRYTRGSIRRQRDERPERAEGANSQDPTSEPEAPYQFGFVANKDGSFRVEDLPAGTYEIEISVYAPPEREGGWWGVERGKGSRTFTIPERSGPPSHEPFDIGTLDVELRELPAVGKPVPTFEIKTVDAKPLKLTDYRGKVVLLEFWATWCGPCVAQVRHLKEVYAAFGGGDRFEIVALSLDADAKRPQAFAVKNELTWVQGFLGDWSEASLPTEYGVNGIPATFLIDPEGRLIARGLHGDDIKPAVEKAIREAFPERR